MQYMYIISANWGIDFSSDERKEKKKLFLDQAILEPHNIT